MSDVQEVRPVAGPQPAPPVFPSPARNFAFAPMGELPKRWRSRLRKLSLGPVEGAMVRWTYHDGSTWALMLFDGERRRAEDIIGWAAFTLQEDRHPILGTYVEPSHRGQGHGSALVREILKRCKDKVPYGIIYAVGDWWEAYTELIEAAGFTHYEWG